MAQRRTSLSINFYSSSRGSRKWLWAAAVAVCLILAFKVQSAINGRTSAGDRGLVHATAPLAVGANHAVAGGFSLLQVFRLPAILRENDQLRQEKAYLEGRIDGLQALAAENAALRKQLKLNPPQAGRIVQATVIARPFDLWLENAVLGVGAEQGVRPGCLVATADGVVGKVIEAAPGFSRIELISSPRFRLAGVTQPGGIEGVASGVASAVMSFDYVEARSKVAVGDKVYSRGSATEPDRPGFTGSPATPAGIYLGRVIEVSSDQGFFLKLKLEPGANTNRLQTVRVYLP